MTTTAVQPIENFCSEKLIMCKYVNDLGSCRLTACARQFTPMTINEAIDFLKKSKWTLAPHALGEAKWNEAVDMAVEALSAKAVQGEWEHWGSPFSDESEVIDTIVCSVCGARFIEPKEEYNYCPNCGKNMRGENYD